MTTKTLTIEEAIKSTGRTFYGDMKIAQSSPPKKEGELEFFKVGKYISDDELEKEYQSRGLEPADIYTLCEHDSELPEWTGTHWKDAKGNWCFAAFGRFFGGRGVRVRRDRGDGWGDGWWFAGVRKSSALGTQTSESLELSPSAPKKKKETQLQVLTRIADALEIIAKKYHV